MDFFVSIKCKKCLCAFELRPENFKQRDSMECPNCGQPFPADAYEKLKIGITTLGEIPWSLPESSDFLNGDAQFTIKMREYNLVQKTLD